MRKDLSYKLFENFQFTLKRPGKLDLFFILKAMIFQTVFDIFFKIILWSILLTQLLSRNILIHIEAPYH